MANATCCPRDSHMHDSLSVLRQALHVNYQPAKAFDQGRMSSPKFGNCARNPGSRPLHYPSLEPNGSRAGELTSRTRLPRPVDSELRGVRPPHTVPRTFSLNDSIKSSGSYSTKSKSQEKSSWPAFFHAKRIIEYDILAIQEP